MCEKYICENFPINRFYQQKYWNCTIKYEFLMHHTLYCTSRRSKWFIRRDKNSLLFVEKKRQDSLSTIWFDTWICYTRLLSVRVCCSAELTLINCSKFQTSCILTFVLGRTDAFIRWFIRTSHTIHRDQNRIKCCTALTVVTMPSPISLFILSKCFLSGHFRRNISIKMWYTTISRVTHAH